jgi:hypothetical protein
MGIIMNIIMMNMMNTTITIMTTDIITKLKPFDICITALALGAVLFSAVKVYAPGNGTLRVVLEGDDRRWEFPLDAAETVTVSGPLGDTIVELRGKQARIVSSPCAGQTCVAAGAIHRHGQWIACLPNQVLVSVQAAGPPGKDGFELDAASW